MPFTDGLSRTLISGAGFFGDQYDNQVISIVESVWEDQYGKIPKEDATQVKWVFYLGCIIGMLGFGSVCDIVGRKWAYCITVFIVAASAIGSASCQWTGGIEGFNLYKQVTLCRFFMGFAVGGEYPLVATVAGESVSAKNRATAILHCFAMQGWGRFFASLIPYICLVAGASDEFTWRFSFAFGALPALCVFPFRLMMEESDAFKDRLTNETADCCQVEGKETYKGAGLSERLSLAESLKRSLKILHTYRYHVIGTALSWFFTDLIFYGQNLYTPDVIAAFGYGHSVLEKAQYNLIMAVFNLVGYYLCIYTIDCIGRKRIQYGSFGILLVLFLILALCKNTFESNSNLGPLFIIIYGLTFVFEQWGPNSTTYLIPGEIFTTSVRTTCHGISAATGKVGALLTTLVFGYLNTTTKMWFSMAMGVCGLLVTLVFTPTYSAADLDIVNSGRAPALDVACLNPAESERDTYADETGEASSRGSGFGKPAVKNASA